MLQKVLTKHRKDPVTDCWIWTDALNTNGYGVVWDPAKQKQCKAHRVAYEELIGPIPDELPLDHLCRNRSCINPAHVQPVTLVAEYRHPLKERGKHTVRMGTSLQEIIFALTERPDIGNVQSVCENGLRIGGKGTRRLMPN